MTDSPVPVLGVVRHVQEGQPYQDSIEIGSASKGGVIKVYGSLDDPVSFERRIREAYRLREIARDLQERQATASA